MFGLIVAALVLGPPPKGTLVILGGGTESPAAFRKILEVAQGPIVILDHSREELGRSSAALKEAFAELGAKDVRTPTTTAEVLDALKDARGVYLSGGDQKRFMERLPEASGVPAAMRAVLTRGGVIGGTSAGASLMGQWMPTGKGETPDEFRADPKAVAHGLNLWPGAIMDQHFLVRSRWTRLFSLVLQTGAETGLGIEEKAWVLVQSGTLEAFEGPTAVVRKARRQPGEALGGEMQLTVLQPGKKLKL